MIYHFHTVSILILVITLNPCPAIGMFADQPAGAAARLPDNVVVEIGQRDLQSIGSWPIERRWYGLAIENLRRQGADSIFIDIAFPQSDPMRPESDRFFYESLRQNTPVFLQHNRSAEAGDTLFILGSLPFPATRTLAPFSESLTISGNLVTLTGLTPRSLAARLLDDNPDERTRAVPLPPKLPDHDFSFLAILKNEFRIREGANVMIYLDHPGVSSYIATQGNSSFPSSLVQWWAVNEIKKGHFVYLWPSPAYGLLVILLIIPAAVPFFRKRAWTVTLSSVYVTGIVVLAVLYGTHMYTPAYLYYSSLVPLPFLLLHHFRNRFIRDLPEEYFEGPDRHLSDEEKRELEQLRYRIAFYDRLKKVAFQQTGGSFGRDDILCHDDSPLMEILAKAHSVSRTNIPVLITGESGTGKEELAKFIHRHSGRSDHPFIAVNCGSLNDNLIESELFGYEKGAFTGADTRKPGRFELADQGTLFLDEIAETAPAFQVKLLRVLQEGNFERVGGTELIHSSVRIVTATHQDPGQLVREGRFREDLYYRLNGFSFHLPPLRERQMDIPVLFQYFVRETAGEEVLHYSDFLLEWLKLQPWKGNVRELKSATSRAVLNASIHNRTVLLPEDFELEQPVTDRNEKAAHILDLFRQYSSDYRFISKVADAIDLHRVTVTEYLRGWIIYYMVRGLNAGQIAGELTGGKADEENKKQLARRVTSYSQTIRSRIARGLDEQLDPSGIESAYFSQLPGFFSHDLHQLIRRYGTQKTGAVE